jgi:hypothetical protein
MTKLCGAKLSIFEKNLEKQAVKFESHTAGIIALVDPVIVAQDIRP